MKTTLFSPSNRLFAAMTIMLDLKIAVIQDGFFPLSTEWKHEVSLNLYRLLSLTDDEFENILFETSQVTLQNALTLQEFRSVEAPDDDRWRVFVGSSINQSGNATECGYICAYNILQDVGGAEVPELTDYELVRALFCDHFYKLINLHADVITFPVRIHKRNEKLLNEVGAIPFAPDPAKEMPKQKKAASFFTQRTLWYQEKPQLKEPPTPGLMYKGVMEETARTRQGKQEKKMQRMRAKAVKMEVGTFVQLRVRPAIKGQPSGGASTIVGCMIEQSDATGSIKVATVQGVVEGTGSNAGQAGWFPDNQYVRIDDQVAVGKDLEDLQKKIRAGRYKSHEQTLLNVYALHRIIHKREAFSKSEKCKCKSKNGCTKNCSCYKKGRPCHSGCGCHLHGKPCIFGKTEEDV